MTPYELLLVVLAAGTNVDGRMGTNGVPLRAAVPPPVTYSQTVAHCTQTNYSPLINIPFLFITLQHKNHYEYTIRKILDQCTRCRK